MARRFSGRTIERSLAVVNGDVACPRQDRLSVAGCQGCLFFCRHDRLIPSVICSYPIPARETLARRARRRHDIRIALAHRLQRT